MATKGIALQGSLFQADKWVQARLAMGIEGQIGSVPDHRNAHITEMRRRGINSRACGSVPAVALIKGIQQQLNADVPLPEVYDDLVANEAVRISMHLDISVTKPTPEHMCPVGIHFITLIPKNPSGRTLHFCPDDEENPIVTDWDTVFVIPNFKDCWDVPSAGPLYQRYFTSVLKEKHFVGTASRLFCLLESIEANLEASVSELPPWRRSVEWKRFLVGPCVARQKETTQRRKQTARIDIWSGVA